jgi:cobalamin biosynthesis Mg chelatase CobN
MSYPQNRLRTRARLGVPFVLTVLAVASTLPATSARGAGTPTFPVPASERAHTATDNTNTSAGTSTPSTGLPSATKNGLPTTATTQPSTAAKGLPTTTSTPQPITALKSTSTAPARTHAQSKPSSKLSTAAIVVAGVAALLALGCAAWGLARRRAFEPHWLLSLRHSMAEAGFRTSATWAEFADWVRLGR